LIPRYRCESAISIKIRLETLELILDGADSDSTGRYRSCCPQHNQELIQCGPQFVSAAPDRARAVATWNVFIEEHPNDSFVDLGEVNSLIAQPVGKVGHAADIDPHR